MYCVECYRRDGKGTVDAPYFFNGKSLCNLDFWQEVESGAGATLVSHAPAELEATSATAKKRGTRLTQDWLPSEASIAKIKGEFPWMQRDHFTSEMAKFTDYWLSKAGKDAVKIDWERTWCNWMRTAAERMPRAASGRLSTVDQKVADLQSMKEPDMFDADGNSMTSYERRQGRG